MKKVALILTLLTCPAFATDQIVSFTEFKGGVDVVTPDKLNMSYAPFDGIYNVTTDEYGMIIKRPNIIQYDNGVTGTFKNSIKYIDDYGNKYMIFHVGNSIYDHFGVLIATVSAVAKVDFAVGEGKVFFTDGVSAGYGGYYDGSSTHYYNTSNSTSMVNGEYVEYWKRRAWRLVNNVLYYSDVDDPANVIGAIVLPTLYGNTYSGMYVWGLADAMYVFQTDAFYEIYETDNGLFTYRLRSTEIGCLFNTCIAELGNRPCWISRKGLVRWNDSGYELLSYDIDNSIRALAQMKIDYSTSKITSAAEWYQGIIESTYDLFTGRGNVAVCIDTYTYSGSIALLNVPAQSTYGSSAQSLSTTYPSLRQSFYFSTATAINGFQIQMTRTSTLNPLSGSITVSLNDSSMSIIKSSVMPVNNISTTTNQANSFNFELSNFCSQGTTYYIVLSTRSDTSGDIAILGGLASTFNRGQSGIYSGGSWTNYDPDYNFKLYAASGSYTSAFYSAPNGSWGRFFATDTLPANTSAEYFLWVSSWTPNFEQDASSLYRIYDGQLINAPSSGGYYRFVSSFSRTDVSSIPKLDDVTFQYRTSNISSPALYQFQDRLYLAISTATQYNNEVWIYQKDKSWTRWGVSVGAFSDLSNVLYIGNSGSNERMYYFHTGTLDVGTFSIDAYWTSPIFGMHPIYKTQFKEIWARQEATTSDKDTVYLTNPIYTSMSYRFDGSTSTFTTSTYTWVGNGIYTRKTNLPVSTKHRQLQFKIRNNTDRSFKIKRIDVIYDDVWGKE